MILPIKEYYVTLRYGYCRSQNVDSYKMQTGKSIEVALVLTNDYLGNIVGVESEKQ